MMLVTAAIVVDGPTRSSQSSAARAIGSNGKARWLMKLEVTSRYRQGPVRTVSRAGGVVVLVAFSVAPAGGESDSVSAAVAAAVRVVRESGFARETHPMYTNIGGDRDE